MSACGSPEEVALQWQVSLWKHLQVLQPCVGSPTTRETTETWKNWTTPELPSSFNLLKPRILVAGATFPLETITSATGPKRELCALTRENTLKLTLVLLEVRFNLETVGS